MSMRFVESRRFSPTAVSSAFTSSTTTVHGRPIERVDGEHEMRKICTKSCAALPAGSSVCNTSTRPWRARNCTSLEINESIYPGTLPRRSNMATNQASPNRFSLSAANTSPVKLSTRACRAALTRAFNTRPTMGAHARAATQEARRGSSLADPRLRAP
eukprot:scaffold101400_cov30-Tisochrysis_lutea.AAC.7